MRDTTVHGRQTSPSATPACAYSRVSSVIRLPAINQYTSSQAAATSAVTASPRTSAMAANR